MKIVTEIDKFSYLPMRSTCSPFALPFHRHDVEEEETMSPEEEETALAEEEEEEATASGEEEKPTQPGEEDLMLT